MVLVLSVADRVLKTIADVTVGTVIVVFHLAIAEREYERRTRMAGRQRLRD